MEELIERMIVKVKKDWDDDGIVYDEEMVRLEVYENMRDSLNVLMSDVAYVTS
jgi:hypothetical protein